MENMVITPSHDFWANKRVLVTGHTGFKGAWLTQWLVMMGAEVVGVSKGLPTQENLFEAAGLANTIDKDYRIDIGEHAATLESFQQERPEVVFHLAAQPLVLESYQNPVETYQSNVMGTMNVLDAIRHTESVRAAVLITTDKCYENKEWLWAYRESDRLGGYDPYSSSKAACEILIASFRDSFFSAANPGPNVASARAGNVIGGGDWAQNRLVPDLLRAVNTGKLVEIRAPESIRPWQHVLEPLNGYLLLAERLLTIVARLMRPGILALMILITKRSNMLLRSFYP